MKKLGVGVFVFFSVVAGMPAYPETAFVVGGDDGVPVKLQLKGLVQSDGRFFFQDAGANANAFLLRRVYSGVDGSAGSDLKFRITIDYVGTPTILDAYVEYVFSPAVVLRTGKFKYPLSLERLQSPSNVALIEAGLPAALSPNRDAGVQVYGTVLDQKLDYQLALLDGAADSASLETDTDSVKDTVVRIVAHPFRDQADSIWRGVGIGIAASAGQAAGTATNTGLGTYKTFGQQTIFRYKTGVYASGSLSRISPQGYWYAGPFGLLWDYIQTSPTVTNGATSALLRHSAWNVTVSYLLTGEDATYGAVKPFRPFNWRQGDWGAFQVVARAGQLNVDGASFGTWADAASTFQQATAIGVGLNWYLNTAVELSAAVERTQLERFGGGSATETVALVRSQFVF